MTAALDEDGSRWRKVAAGIYSSSLPSNGHRSFHSSSLSLALSLCTLSPESHLRKWSWCMRRTWVSVFVCPCLLDPLNGVAEDVQNTGASHVQVRVWDLLEPLCPPLSVCSPAIFSICIEKVHFLTLFGLRDTHAHIHEHAVVQRYPLNVHTHARQMLTRVLQHTANSKCSCAKL